MFTSVYIVQYNINWCKQVRPKLPWKNVGAWARFGGLCPLGPNVEPPLQNRSLVFSSNITKTSVAYPGIARFNSNRNFSHSLAAPSKVCGPPQLRVLRGPKHGTGHTFRTYFMDIWTCLLYLFSITVCFRTFCFFYTAVVYISSSLISVLF